MGVKFGKTQKETMAERLAAGAEKGKQLDGADTVSASLNPSLKGKHNASLFDLWCTSHTEWPLFPVKSPSIMGGNVSIM